MTPKRQTRRMRKDAVISIRVTPSVLAEIDAGAAAAGKTRTAFMMEAATHDAMITLALHRNLRAAPPKKVKRK